MNQPFYQTLKTLGAVQTCAPLAPYTTFKIGGPAEVLFEPNSVENLAQFWALKPKETPVTILGGGSNVLIRDGGVRGIVVVLGQKCGNILHSGTSLYVEVGASTGKVARVARGLGLSGVEFLCGIPGSMGGALVMNAGCYGQELKDCLIAVDVLDASGTRHTLPAEVFKFSYRQSFLPKGWLFLAAHLRLQKSSTEKIRTQMRTINHKRAQTQPLKWPNAGSFFKNPPKEMGEKAWQLIADAGCVGLQKGGAKVSEKHCNFFINTGAATATDMEDLAEVVAQKVYQKSGVSLIREVRLLGDRTRAF